MSKYFLLLWFQIKAAFKALPRLILATLIFSLLVAFVGFAGTKILSNNDESNKLDIALILPSDADMYTALAFSFLSDIETVKNVCSFIEMDHDTAFESLKSGSVDAIILLPDNFVHHILDGTNTPAKIILPKSTIASKSILFRTLINAGVDDLAAAQAGIYAVTDICRYYKIPDSVSQSENDLNKAYFSYALDRSIYFKSQTISDTGNLSTIQFYVCSGLVLLLLLSGISCSDLLKRENEALCSSLKRRKIPVFLLFLFKIIGVTLVFFLLLLFSYFMSRLASIRFPKISDIIAVLNIGSLSSLLLLTFGIFAFILCVFQFANHQSLGVLLLFTFSTLMLFISGAIIPSTFLPEAIQTIALFLPTTYYLKLCGEILTNSTSLFTVGINIVFAILFIITTTIIDRIHQNKI